MNLSDICRLCLVKSKKNNEELFFPIDESLELKFNAITNLKFAKSSADDSQFPNNVCMSCTDELEHHINYRNGLIDKQKRLNSLLGVVATAEPLKEDPADARQNIRTGSHHQPEELEVVEIREPRVIKANYSDDEEAYEAYEQVENEQLYLIENLDDEPDEHNVSEAEDVEVEEDDIETTIDQLEEEDYQIDPETEDYQMATVKADGEFEDEYDIVHEDDITMEEEATQVKRKYTKQSRDYPKQFKCWIKNCCATFSFRATMKKHMKQVHSILADKSTCFICGKRYENYPDFLSHMKGHTRKSQCDVCKLTFVDGERLAKHKSRFHKKSDDDERNFQCHICQARFKRKEHVNSHVIYKHSDKDARKFQCKDCASSFLTRQDLKNHEKSHSQVMIDCIYCAYQCRDLKSIRRHAFKLHNSLNIYKCNCEETFEKFRDLQVHKKNCSGVIVSGSISEY